MEQMPGPAPAPPVLPPAAPLYAPAPPPPPRRGGMLILVLVFMLCVVVGFVFFSMFSNLGFGGKRVAQSGHRLQEVVVEDNAAGAKVAILDVKGMITSEPWNRGGDNLVDILSDQLKLAAEDEGIKAVILKIDSPGGEVMASDDISRAIRDFQRETKKPVIASMGGLAASGGYYVAVPCDWIVANELTITGSIGVIMNSFNYRGLLDKIGVRPEVFKSGKYKDLLRGSKAPDEILPEERQMIQALIDETYQKFRSVVAEGRQNAFNKHKDEGAREMSPDWPNFADGRILTGKQAFELGFVDELGNFETAVERTKRLIGSRRVNLVRYVQPFDLSNLFRFFIRSDPPSLRIDVGLELPRLQAGRLYFLSPTVMH